MSRRPKKPLARRPQRERESSWGVKFMIDQNAAKHELSITRLIHASPETVYKVWTERTGEWWAPRPYTTPVIDFELRPGGRAYTMMRSPDGADMPHDGVFLEVVPNRKIVVTDA